MSATFKPPASGADGAPPSSITIPVISPENSYPPLASNNMLQNTTTLQLGFQNCDNDPAAVGTTLASLTVNTDGSSQPDVHTQPQHKRDAQRANSTCMGRILQTLITKTVLSVFHSQRLLLAEPPAPPMFLSLISPQYNR